MLVLGRIDFNTSLLFGIGGFGLIGLWALLTSGMGLRGYTLPGAAAWAGLVLSVAPTLALLAVLRADNRAIFRAASHASKAADYLLAFVRESESTLARAA